MEPFKNPSPGNHYSSVFVLPQDPDPKWELRLQSLSAVQTHSSCLILALMCKYGIDVGLPTSGGTST